MITLNISGKDYPIRTSWSDVTYLEYAELKNPYAEEKKLLQKISHLTGIEIEVIASLSIEHINIIIPLVLFMESDITEFDKVDVEWMRKKDDENISDIKADSWARLEKAKQIFQKVENPYLAIAEVVKEYVNFDMTDKPVSEVYGYADFFFHNSTLFRSDTKG